MSPIPLFFRAIDYTSDTGDRIQAWRVRVEVEFVRRDGLHMPQRAIFDSGAPLSVVPHSLWHGMQLQWRPLGRQLTVSATGQPAPDALLWMGQPCELGETEVFLLDIATRTRTGPHRFVAKFVQNPFPPHMVGLETVRIVGLNFLSDNAIGGEWTSAGGVVAGQFNVP